MNPTKARPSRSRFGGDLAAEHLERRVALLHEQPVDVTLCGPLRAPHLELELDRGIEAVAVALERPCHALPYAAAHRRLVARRRPRKVRVKVLEREVQRAAVGGCRRARIFHRRASVAIEPLARTLGVRVERRGAEVAPPGLYAGGGLGRRAPGRARSRCRRRVAPRASRPARSATARTSPQSAHAGARSRCLAGSRERAAQLQRTAARRRAPPAAAPASLHRSRPAARRSAARASHTRPRRRDPRRNVVNE